MTATFNCPQCGAPLTYDLYPGDETVECEFCQTTVAIPEDMRIELPPLAIEHLRPTPKQRSLVTIFAWIGVFAVVFAAIAIIGSMFDSSGAPPSNGAAFQSNSATIDAQATSDQAALKATAVFEAQATTTALQPLLKQAQNWPVRFADAFTDQSHNWKTGDVRDDSKTGNRSINDGRYIWNLTTLQSGSFYSFPDMPDQTDFFASVDIYYTQMPDDADADAGLAFRYNDTDQSWYYYSINDQGQYYFGWYDGSEWHTLILEDASTVIRQGLTNHLAVGARGSQFIFLINGQMVDHFIDDSSKSGTIGVGINLPEVDQKAIVEFSNFSILGPEAAP